MLQTYRDCVLCGGCHRSGTADLAPRDTFPEKYVLMYDSCVFESVKCHLLSVERRDDGVVE